MLYKKNSSKNFRNIHRKTPVLESLFNKVAGLQTCNYLKKTPTPVFSCKCSKIFKNTQFEEHLRTADSVGFTNRKFNL